MTRRLATLASVLFAVGAIGGFAASVASATLADFAVSGESPIYPAHLAATGQGKQTLTFSGFTLTCTESEGVPPVELTATTEEQSGSINFATPEGKTGTEVWQNCHATVLKIPLTVHQNGCELEFTAGSLAMSGETSTGGVNIVNCNGGATKGITITIGNEATVCHIDVPEQNTTTGSVHYRSEAPEGGAEHILATAENVGLVIDTTGGTQCEGKTGEAKAETATYNGEVDITATEEGKSIALAGT